MIAAVRSQGRKELVAGLALGIYAVAIALVPGVPTKALLCAPLLGIPLFWSLLRTSTAWLALFFACALLTPPLPISLGDSGPHVAILTAGVGLFIGVLRLGEWRFQPDGLALSLIGLWLIFACSVAMAALYSGVAIAAGSLARVLLFGISIYVFLYVRDGPGRLGQRRVGMTSSFRCIRWLFWAGALSALFACVDFYFQFAPPAGYEQQFVWLESGVYRRAQGFFYEASTLGNLCAFFLEMVAVTLFLRKGDQAENQPLSRRWLFIGAAPLAAALVLSFSRASLVNLAVATIALVWLRRDHIRWQRLAVGGALLGAGVGVALWTAFPMFARAAWMRVSAAFEYFSESPNVVLSGRIDAWQTLADYLIANPWRAVLGVGYKTLPYSDFIGTKAVGDNTYLTLLAETGIAGLIAVIALNVAILAYAYRAARSTDSVRSFTGAWMFCFWAGQSVQMLSADLLTYWRVLPVYFFVLALATRRPA
jgi:O-antigen ligase